MYRSSPFRSTLNTGYIKLRTCVEYVPKQTIPWQCEKLPFYTYGFQSVSKNMPIPRGRKYVVSKNNNCVLQKTDCKRRLRFCYCYGDVESRLRTNSLGEVLGSCFFPSMFESMTKRLTFLSIFLNTQFARTNFPGARTTLYVGEREQDELHKFALEVESHLYSNYGRVLCSNSCTGRLLMNFTWAPK